MSVAYVGRWFSIGVHQIHFINKQLQIDSHENNQTHNFCHQIKCAHLIPRNDENDLSVVADVTGNVK